MNTTLHRLLERSARARPDHVALVDGDRAVTYASLDARANRIAALLRDLGVRNGDRVAVYREKSAEAVTALYGIMKAGAAYVPVDVRAPVSRAAYILENCGVQVLLSGVAEAGAWKDLTGPGSLLAHVVNLDAAPVSVAPPEGLAVHEASAIDARPADAVDAGAIDLDLAYILYTSGSTGVPKGVKLSHRNALAFVEWAVEEFGVGPDDRLSSHAPLHFDLSVFDLYGAASVGATVVLVPPKASVFPIEIGRFIDRHEITTWYSVPSVLSMLVQRGNLSPGALPSLRTLLFAGEVFPTKFLRRLMLLLPHVAFANLYGPTETNVCTAYRVPEPPREEDGDIPIGGAITGVETFAVTDEGARALPGEVGELYVRGSTVMRGYWGAPEETAKRLVANPFDRGTGDPVYRTGDLVAVGADGGYRFLGRRDNQIKSRGYRIELGEIETALYRNADVVECAAVAVPDDLVTNRIRVWVVARGGLTDHELTRYCRERLPAYMVPDEFRLTDTLPKTSTGKIDRRQLATT